MLCVNDITMMQQAAVSRWHQTGIDNPYSGFLRIACHECSLNYLLWHEEDAARCPHASDLEIAHVKRVIDKLNQERNDYIERLDDWIAAYLRTHGEPPTPDAPLNTETPGSVIDRLSILALRIYHLDEQTRRSDVGREHIETIEFKLAVCLQQSHDLSRSLEQLLDDILAGRKKHQLYRHFKLYNDPATNPFLYGSADGESAQSAASGSDSVPAGNCRDRFDIARPDDNTIVGARRDVRPPARIDRTSGDQPRAASCATRRTTDAAGEK